ncbi:hypothetical protein LO762_20515 [Actinocorallia sp. API 0066]|uniref:hypothetical protein n=1 Tax=Actinocorallia sp. API 0066 TaxID=2896846 RepID=UPI001E2D2C73|nr:hypothetical protein [Actinocorallia sp. API 0066]MCD0451560.1 hypothetical protein [Actinocorallia sp. API 0066]
MWHRPSNGRALPVVRPSDEETIGSVPVADGRSALMERLADELEATYAERAALTTVRNGMPIARWTRRRRSAPRSARPDTPLDERTARA